MCWNQAGGRAWVITIAQGLSNFNFKSMPKPEMSDHKKSGCIKTVKF